MKFNFSFIFRWWEVNMGPKIPPRWSKIIMLPMFWMACVTKVWEGCREISQRLWDRAVRRTSKTLLKIGLYSLKATNWHARKKKPSGHQRLGLHFCSEDSMWAPGKTWEQSCPPSAESYGAAKERRNCKLYREAFHLNTARYYGKVETRPTKKRTLYIHARLILQQPQSN